ncbi:MAG TPA: ribosome maturation factor RimP [Candidatus Sulfotelmatobacter sp.]
MALDVDRVREIAERVASSSGLEVVDVEFRGGGKSRMLRVFLDKLAPGTGAVAGAGLGQDVAAGSGSSADDAAGSASGVTQEATQGHVAGVALGVTHEDCANFSREFGTILDVEDAMPGGSYTLEVSSPGLDRKLTKASDFERFTGSRMKLMTRQAVNNNRYFDGRLESFRDGRLTLDLSVASKKSRKKMGAAAATGEQKIEIEFANVESANLVPEI